MVAHALKLSTREAEVDRSLISGLSCYNGRNNHGQIALYLGVNIK